MPGTPKTVLCVCLVLFPSIGAADTDYNAIFEDAVAAVEFDFGKRWAFTETRIDSENVWVGRSDPRRASSERWQLLTVDDRAPTEKEIREYRKEKRHDHADDDDNRVEAMVEPDSIRLIEETTDYWLLGFNPGDDERQSIDSLDATIRISKADKHLEYIDLRTRSAFRPATGIKIANFVTRLTFGPAVDGGPVVPLSTQVDVKGRAFLFINFDEQELRRNSDFDYVGDELEMVPDR